MSSCCSNATYAVVARLIVRYDLANLTSADINGRSDYAIANARRLLCEGLSLRVSFV